MADKGRISFGVEIEMLVAYIYEGQPRPKLTDGSMASFTASDESLPMLRLPWPPAHRDPDGFCNEAIRDKVNDLLTKHGFKDNQDRTANWLAKFVIPDDMCTDGGKGVARMVNHWRADTESLHEPDADYLKPLKFVGIELQSPAAWSESPDSFEEIKRVLDVLKQQFHLRVNPTCGLHVHVGRGFLNGFPNDPPVVQRFAALVWAADPVLSVLHPPERRISYYGSSIRDNSELAQLTLPDMPQADDLDGKPLKEIFNWRHPPTAQALSRLPLPSSLRTLHPQRRPRGPEDRFPTVRVNPKAVPAAMHRVHHYYLHNRSLERPETATAIAGCAVLLACRSGEKAAQLIQAVQGYERLNFNVNSLVRGEAYLWPKAEVDVEAFVEAEADPEWNRDGATIEFREAVGSLDPDWIATWARIAAGLVRFAWDAPEDDYYAVLARLAEAQGEFRAEGPGQPDPVPYDVVDLLEDIGLPAEADFVEEQLLKGDDFWFPLGNIAEAMELML